MLNIYMMLRFSFEKQRFFLLQECSYTDSLYSTSKDSTYIIC
jgi:hypothetical protein